jgi:energy-coupling factor transport system permease protein
MSGAAISTPLRGTVHAPVLNRAHPLAKLGAAFVITVALLATVDWVSASVALAFELAVLPLTGLGYTTLVRRGWPILAAAVMSGYSTALLAADSGRIVVAVGAVTISTGALATGLAIALRGLAIALPGVMVLTCTDPTDLADGLAQKLRFPHRFVLGALAALRLVGLLSQEWSMLGMARRARGAGSQGRVLRRVLAQLEQGLALLVQAIRRATRLAVTMEARGFGGDERTWARASTYSRIDLWVCAAGILVAAAAVAAAVVTGTWNPIWH